MDSRYREKHLTGDAIRGGSTEGPSLSAEELRAGHNSLPLKKQKLFSRNGPLTWGQSDPGLGPESHRENLLSAQARLRGHPGIAGDRGTGLPNAPTTARARPSPNHEFPPSCPCGRRAPEYLSLALLPSGRQDSHPDVLTGIPSDSCTRKPLVSHPWGLALG